MSVVNETESAIKRAARVLEQAEQFRRVGEDGSADAALARAAAIMARHSIDLATIDAERRALGQASQEQIGRLILDPFTGIYAKMFVQLYTEIAAAVGTVTAISVDLGKLQQVWLVGTEADAEQVKMLGVSLLLQAQDAMARWAKTANMSGLTAMEKFKNRRQFLLSFAIAAADRIRGTLNQAVDEAGDGTAIVLIDRKTRVDNFVKETYKIVSKQTNWQPGTVDAAIAGTVAGRNTNIGQTAVNGGRRAIASGSRE